MIPFVHLHVHSQYSILDGQAPVKALVDKAIADGMRGMAITDHDNMFGIKEFHDYVAKLNKKRGDDEKFKPIFGCEVYVANNSRHDRIDKRDNGNHLILLAKNLKGYKNLIKIVSHAWTEGMYYHPRTDHSELEKYHEGIICSSACLGGEVPQLIMNGQMSQARETIRWFKSVFGDVDDNAWQISGDIEGKKWKIYIDLKTANSSYAINQSPRRKYEGEITTKDDLKSIIQLFDIPVEIV